MYEQNSQGHRFNINSFKWLVASLLCYVVFWFALRGGWHCKVIRIGYKRKSDFHSVFLKKNQQKMLLNGKEFIVQLPETDTAAR